jgi:hypothetical protein
VELVVDDLLVDDLEGGCGTVAGRIEFDEVPVDDLEDEWGTDGDLARGGARLAGEGAGLAGEGVLVA